MPMRKRLITPSNLRGQFVGTSLEIVSVCSKTLMGKTIHEIPLTGITSECSRKNRESSKLIGYGY